MLLKYLKNYANELITLQVFIAALFWKTIEHLKIEFIDGVCDHDSNMVNARRQFFGRKTHDIILMVLNGDGLWQTV